VAGTLTVERRGPRTAGELLGFGSPQPGVVRTPEKVLAESDGDPRPPHVRLRMTLEAARRRGELFNAVWPSAVDDAVLGQDTQRERELWHGALWGTRDEWERAYARQGPRINAFDALLMGMSD
jgi:hypothetical protein